MAPMARRPYSGGPADHKVTPTSEQPGWLSALGRYLVLAGREPRLGGRADAALHALADRHAREEIAFAVLHCTAGDVCSSQCPPSWPRWCCSARRTGPAAASCRSRWRPSSPELGTRSTASGRNLVRGAWAYSDLMPVVPRIVVGLAPLAQWLLIPAASLAWACRPWRVPPYTMAVTRQAPG